MNSILQFIIHLYNSLNNKKISNEIYEELRIPLFDNNNYIVDLNISKNILKNNNVDIVYLFCHSVTGDKYEFAYIAKDILKNNKAGVISYNRKFRNSKSTLSSGTISLNENINCEFNITGCRYLLDSLISYLYKHILNKYTKIILVGFSAGTSLIACYLGCNKIINKNKIKYSILVSAGFHYKESMKNMPMFSKIICFLNVYFYFKHIHINLNHSLLLDTIYYVNIFIYIAKLYKYSNFKTVNEYFLEHDPIYYLKNIHSKVYFINSLDDFCFPDKTILPIISKYKYKKNFTFYLEKRGGHICFYKDLQFNNKIIDYINKLELLL